MGIQDLGHEDELIARRDLTIGDLIDIFGREPTRRGLEYMKSLNDAEKEFVESISQEELEKGWREAYNMENVGEDAERAASKWADESREKGLGLDE